MGTWGKRTTFPLLGIADVRAVPVFIYAFAEPATGEFRYVGKSSAPKLRLSAHRSSSPRLSAWCASLIEKGTPPKIVILKEVPPGEDADPWERRLIAKHRGPRLLNQRF